MINIKDLYKVFEKAGKIDEYQKILDLIDDSFKNREKIEESKKENDKLRKENKELQEKLNLQEDLEPKNNAYWKKSNGDGPFCTRCFDKNKEIIRIPLKKDICSTCPECKNEFNLTGEERHSCVLNDNEDFNKLRIF